MRNTTFKLIVPALTLALFLGISCKGGSAAKNSLEGHWEGDVEAMKEMNPELSENPMAGFFFAMIASMKFEFTKDAMHIETMGEKQTTEYEIVSTTDDGVQIKATNDGDTKILNVKFVDKGQIQIFEDGNDEPPLVLRRVQG